MRRVVVGVSAAFALTAFGAVNACGVGNDCDFGLCAGPLADGPGDGGLGQDGEGPDIVKPANCDENADATSDAARGCVVDSFALFVDGDAGNDANDGSKAKPLKKISSAIAKVGSTGKRRIYICGSGTYAEHLKLTTAVNLHGGFACSSWTPDTTAKAKVAPTDKGYAFHIDNVSAGVTLSDLDVIATADSAIPGDSAVAVFVATSTAQLRRVNISSGPGTPGLDGAARSNYSGTATGGGLSNSAAAGTGPTCTCANGTSSKGGQGATGSGTGLENGVATPPVGGMNSGSTAAGSCNPGLVGANGLAGAPGEASNASGTLSATGWTNGTVGQNGKDGNPAQGGGGGGARTDLNLGGGGGGCGGCGGAGGGSGGNGGSSFTLLSFSSAISVEGGSLTTAAAGPGGAGGRGQDGQAGGAFGGGTCNGGPGGSGAGGSGGGGGAGGHSIPIAFVGTEPRVSGATLTPGPKGLSGKGGAPGEGPGTPGNTGNAGPEGKSQQTLSL